MNIELRPGAVETDREALLAVWRSSVEATHAFLTTADVDRLERQIGDVYLSHVDLTVATVDGRIAGFSGLADGVLEMLFVHAGQRGNGIGGLLLRDAIDKVPRLRLDVNEQNPQAVGFYQRYGFEQVGRSETDGEGRPFPLLHLELPGR